MFKHRRSSSTNLGALKTLTKISPVDSQLLSPTLKPGFEQVGLLPSERESLETTTHSANNEDDETVETAIMQDFRSVAGINTPHILDTGLDVLSTTHMNESAERIAKEEKFEREHSIQHPFKKAISTTYNEDAEGGVGIMESSSIPGAGSMLRGSVSASALLGFTPGGYTDADQTSNEPVSNFVTVASDRRSSHNMSFASNIFDNHDPLSQGIREYVTSKIAEALEEQERQRFQSTQEARGVPRSSEPSYGMSGFAKEPGSTLFNKNVNQIYLFTGSKRIGPLVIDHSTIATNSQLTIVVAYAAIVLFSAAIGPKTFFLTIWRLSVFLSVYYLSVRFFNWTNSTRNDILPSPICYLGHEMQNLASETLEAFRKSKIPDLEETHFLSTHDSG